MTEQEPYYESALTGDVLPENELSEVTVWTICADGHNHFEKKWYGDVYIEKDELPGSKVGVELLIAHGKLISVYTEDLEYGRAYPVEHERIDGEKWKAVVAKA